MPYSAMCKEILIKYVEDTIRGHIENEMANLIGSVLLLCPKEECFKLFLLDAIADLGIREYSRSYIERIFKNKSSLPDMRSRNTDQILKEIDSKLSFLSSLHECLDERSSDRVLVESLIKVLKEHRKKIQAHFHIPERNPEGSFFYLEERERIKRRRIWRPTFWMKDDRNLISRFYFSRKMKSVEKGDLIELKKKKLSKQVNPVSQDNSNELNETSNQREKCSDNIIHTKIALRRPPVMDSIRNKVEDIAFDLLEEKEECFKVFLLDLISLFPEHFEKMDDFKLDNIDKKFKENKGRYDVYEILDTVRNAQFHWELNGCDAKDSSFVKIYKKTLKEHEEKIKAHFHVHDVNPKDPSYISFRRKYKYNKRRTRAKKTKIKYVDFFKKREKYGKTPSPLSYERKDQQCSDKILDENKNCSFKTSAASNFKRIKLDESVDFTKADGIICPIANDNKGHDLDQFNFFNYNLYGIFKKEMRRKN